MGKTDMQRAAEAAARQQAQRGGDEVHSVTLVGDPALVSEGLWLVKVRLMMRDGTARAYECNATTRELFAVREVPAG